jgi:Tol biopolymer transport system component/ABC-type transport system involved in multi-copper enzyme maturation permease subunit
VFKKLFLKEWRERVGLVVFPFLIMLIFVLIILTHPGQKKEVVEYLYGMMFLIFLPLTSLLLGASAFQPEFKDDAWAYLFSRPVTRWKIWAIKLFSLSTILFSIMLVFFLINSALLKRIKISLATYYLYHLDILESNSIFLFTLVVCISAFIISFCLSFLHEKQYVILTASILIGVLVFWSSRIYFAFILEKFYLWSYGPTLFYLFALMSLMIASILTFVKSDFSQEKKKIWTFSKFALLFLVISFGLETARYFTHRTEIISFSGVHKGDAYFVTDRGIFRYFLNMDKLERITKLDVSFLPWESPTAISIRDDKLYFNNYIGWSENVKELWVVNTDGSQKKLLLERSDKKDSPFYNLWVRTLVISEDGKQVAFAAETLDDDRSKRKNIISFMNLDGTGLIKKSLDIPLSSDVRALLWQEYENSMILVISEDYTNEWIAKLNIENGDVQEITHYNRMGYRNRLRISPHQDQVAFCSQQETGNSKTLSILDVKTLEKKEIYTADSIAKLKWSSDGDKIAFLARGNELWVHSLRENKTKKIKVFEYANPPMIFPDFDFVFDGQKMAVVDLIDGEYYLKILRVDGHEEREMKIPFRIKYSLNVPKIFGLDNIVLVKNIEEEDLWRANLDTENWRRIYR